ncbi:MAG TPA: OmpH family outer membrane protein [Elusimicrobiales bacterium]|nr:OmpH family outer membrane protein [Elusimicrobiales bacterium]
MKTALIILAVLLPPGAGALELSLEENRGESGTIGYVDMDRVFRKYSGTSGAREEFLSEVKKRETGLDDARKRIFALRAEISRLRQEREFAAALPIFFSEEQPPAASTAAAAGTGTPPPAEPAQASSAPAGAELPAGAAQLPGMQPGTTEEAGRDAAAAPPPPAQEPVVHPAAPKQPLIQMPGVGAMALDKFRMSVSTSVPEIEAAISAKEKELAGLESALRTEQRRAEKDLLEQESRKTELILGRIYFLLRELAVSEGVSVVIDKRSILFGHAAVDLTGKLLEKLEDPGEGERR